VVGAIAKIGSLITAVVRLAAGDVSLVLASGKLRRVGRKRTKFEWNFALNDTDKFSAIGYVMSMLCLY
jgi:hypothetical protein